MRKTLYPLIFLSVVLLWQSSVLWAAVPSGYYYFAKNKKKAELKTALATYCAPLRELSFGSGPGFTWEGFFKTDNRNDTVIDRYSSIIRTFNGYTAVTDMHIEHSLPKSWWGAYENGAYKDLFHLYPADGLANENKNNLPLGEVTGTPSFDNGVTKVGKNGFETAYTDNCFEPADEYKGDFARSYFYIATIYQNLAPLWQSPMMNNNTYPVWTPWAIDLLLKWHHQDPVSDKELARVEAVYNIQGNRNPFIDYPALADYIWGADSTKVFPFPEETEPFLVTPRAGTTVDFGVILQHDSRAQTLHLLGVNIAADMQLSLVHNSSTLTLSTPAITMADALAGTDIGITFHPTAGGQTLDTLLISGGGLAESLRIPIKALASSDFITLEPTDIKPVGGTLQWIADPYATNYRLNVYQGDANAGDLIISTYVEGSSWNKAIELYNGTGKTVDLSNYALQKQSNGAGAFGSTLNLSGTLDNNKTYVIVHKQAATDLLAKAQLVTDSLLQYNGNDAIALVRNGVTVDMVGQANAGADVTWGLDVTLQRKSSVTHPITTYNANEWNSFPIDSYTMLGAHTMSFASSSTFILQNVLTGLTTSYVIANLPPENTYTYSVESMRSGVIVPAINTMQLHTLALDVPIAMEAMDIRPHQFTANWEETPYATGYLLDVYTITGQADVTETEGFPLVGTSGTPLPNGWTGSASGNYTTTASSGVAAPSVGLKNNGEWLQTKTYSAPVSKFSYMYRFASAATGSSLGVYGLSNGIWTRIDTIPYVSTSKIYPSYPFTKSQAMTTFRFIYHKAAGNMAIDDVSATYGNQDTMYVCKNNALTTNQFVVDNLTENTTYHYKVRATLGSAVSPYSDLINAQTTVSTALHTTLTSPVKLYTDKQSIHISGLKGNEMVQLYSVTGICLYQRYATGSEININFGGKGIFILRVQNSEYRYTTKVCK